MVGGRFTITCWVTLSKSLGLSEPTFFVTCPPGMGKVENAGCYRHVDKRHEGVRGGESDTVLDDIMHMSAHMCADEMCVATAQSQDQDFKDAQFSIISTPGITHVIHCRLTPHMDKQFSNRPLPPQGQFSGFMFSLHQSSFPKTYQGPVLSTGSPL